MILAFKFFKFTRLQKSFANQDLHVELGEAGVDLSRTAVDLSDLFNAILQIKGIFSDLREGKVQISITGGMRALILATFIAYLLTDWKTPPNVEVFLEGRGVTLKVPELTLILRPLIDKRKMALLKRMGPGRTYRPRELCELVGRDRSTIYRHLKVLSGMGLVERGDRGFRLTRLGELLAK